MNSPAILIFDFIFFSIFALLFVSFIIVFLILSTGLLHFWSRFLICNLIFLLLFTQVIFYKFFIAVHICADDRVAHKIPLLVDKQGGGDANHIL